VSLRPPRLVLFDIDGTLVTAAGAGRSALSRALLATYGVTGPIDAYDFRGKTDPRIVTDLMRGAGLDEVRITAGFRPATPPTSPSWRRSSATAGACA
jgi:beta-phosphoglucomutase-like phosphatase (HAD superfamily)